MVDKVDKEKNSLKRKLKEYEEKIINAKSMKTEKVDYSLDNLDKPNVSPKP